uniref:leucine--tRNA ligase n=1 Tax=Ditylenchus dipsaci TaxID=166011 RepID=A0A915DN27_9BILA
MDFLPASALWKRIPWIPSLIHLENRCEQMPVDVYVGGVEHADVHLFFARFISYFLYDLGILKSPEPVKKLISQGYVLGKTFSLESTGAFLENKDVEETKDLATNICTYVQKSTGSPVAMSYAKMSKSKRNGVDPLEVIERDGVDLARLQLLDSAAPQQPLQWGFTQESDMRGIKRFLFRLARLVGIYVEERTKLGNTFDPLPAEEEEIYKDHFNNYVKALSMNLEILCVHNAAFEQLQGLIKYLQKAEPNTVGRSSEIERCIHAMVIMLQVFAPHAAAELWAALSNAPKIQNHLWNSSAHVSFQDWPKTDKDCIIDVLLHINGELMASRARRNVIEPLSAEETIAFAKQSAHATFFDLLCEAGLQVKEIEVVKNYGLDVHLHLTMEDDVSKESVLNVLKQIWKAKILSRKESKKVKKLKSVV